MKTLLITFTVVILTAFLLAVAGSISAADKYQEMLNCDLHAGPCVQSVSGYTVTFEVTPRPVKAMKDLSFRITLDGKLPENPDLPYIDLGMHTPPRPGSPDVRCPSGRRIWQATITLPDVGRINFIFDVIY